MEGGGAARVVARNEKGGNKMKVRELMTAQPATVRPDQSVRDAAELMCSNDCGCLPVEKDGRLVGVITDRDIVMRAIAADREDASVCDIMSPEPCSCGPDDAVERVELIMAELKVRRVPVVDGSGHAIGMVSQADLARAANGPHLIPEGDVAQVVSHISQPGRGRTH